MKFAYAPFFLAAATACGPTQALTTLNGDTVEATAATGIVPEYAPSSAVLFDDSLFLDNLEESTALVKAVAATGVKIWFTGSNEGNTRSKLEAASIPLSGFRFFPTGFSQNPWVRDYGPVAVQTASGRAFLDFGYRPEEGDLGDAVPAKIGEALGIPVVVPGINLDLGNLTCDDKLCLVAHYAQDNDGEGDDDDDDDDDASAAARLTEEQIERLSEALGRKVHAVDKLPYEATGHIDLWAKIFAPGKVLVSQLMQSQLEAAYPTGVPSWVKKVRKFYDQQAENRAGMGLEVVRVPSPVPDRAFEQPRFRSYVNSLQVGARLVVPRYVADHQDDPENKPYLDAALLTGYEQKIQETMAQQGIEVTWAASDFAILGDGAVHCQTMQIAE